MRGRAKNRGLAAEIKAQFYWVCARCAGTMIKRERGVWDIDRGVVFCVGKGYGWYKYFFAVVERLGRCKKLILFGQTKVRN